MLRTAMSQQWIFLAALMAFALTMSCAKEPRWRTRTAAQRRPGRGRPPHLGDLDLSKLASLEIDVAEGLPVPFPLPRPPSRRITQADFPAIIAAARAQAIEEFGPEADRPDR